MSLFSTDDYQKALQALIPTGRAWTRDPKAVQAAVLRAIAASFQRSDNDALALLRGAFPKTATIMLTEWEKHSAYLMIAQLAKWIRLRSVSLPLYRNSSAPAGSQRAISSVLPQQWVIRFRLRNTGRRVLAYRYVVTG